MTAPPTVCAAVRPVSQLVSRPLTWLWPGRLALGKLAILDGDPGLGKSLVTLDLCARLSTGRPFPDGSCCPGVGNSIVLNGEDGAEDTIRPRLQALGADLERVSSQAATTMKQASRFASLLTPVRWTEP
jgi:putative DNA primase/helicase